MKEKKVKKKGFDEIRTVTFEAYYGMSNCIWLLECSVHKKLGECWNAMGFIKSDNGGQKLLFEGYCYVKQKELRSFQAGLSCYHPNFWKFLERLQKEESLHNLIKKLQQCEVHFRTCAHR